VGSGGGDVSAGERVWLASKAPHHSCVRLEIRVFWLGRRGTRLLQCCLNGKAAVDVFGSPGEQGQVAYRLQSQCRRQ
jgi:hypothetical protein